MCVGVNTGAGAAKSSVCLYNNVVGVRGRGGVRGGE